MLEKFLVGGKYLFVSKACLKRFCSCYFMGVYFDTNFSISLFFVHHCTDDHAKSLKGGDTKNGDDFKRGDKTPWGS